jgi:hypothetical protein
MGPRERIELAPLIEQRAPASIKTAAVASMNFFSCFTGTTSNIKIELRKRVATRLGAFQTYVGSCPTKLPLRASTYLLWYGG